MLFAALIKATFEIPKWNDLDLRIFSFQNWAFWNRLLGFTLTTRFRCGRRFQQTLTANKWRKMKSMWTKACCVYGGDDWSHHISGWIGFGDLGAFWSFWIWWNHQDFKNKPFFWRLEDPASLQNHLCFGSRGSSWKTPSLSTCFFVWVSWFSKTTCIPKVYMIIVLTGSLLGSLPMHHGMSVGWVWPEAGAMMKIKWGRLYLDSTCVDVIYVFYFPIYYDLLL